MQESGWIRRFSVLDTVLLRDAPVREPKSLDSIYVTTPAQRPDQLSWIEYQVLTAEAHSFNGIVAEDRQSPMFTYDVAYEWIT